MQPALIRLLLRLNGWRLWVLFSLGAVLSTELITSLMDLLLKGEITADYMLTGLVAAGLVAPSTLFLLSYALRELSRSQQEALAHSVDSAEARLKVALDSSDEGILMVARDGKVLSANKRFLELWRVPPELAAAGQDEPLLAHVLDQLADPDGFMGQVRRLYGSDEEANDTLQFKDGRVFARYTRALSLGREQGRIWCFKDITDQAHTQEALAEREELYRAIVSQAGDGIDLVDAETLRFVEVNEAACRMLGYRREELVQQPLSMIQADLTEAALREVVAGILQSGHGSFEARHCCKDGRILDVHTNVRVIRLQGRDFLACIWRDISERIAAERAMQQLNADLDATLQAIPDLLFEMSGSGEYIRVWARNPELLAAHEEVLLGHTVSEILPPEAANTVMAALDEAGTKGYSHGKVIRLSLLRGDSWFELSTAVKAGTDSSSNRFIMLSRDITERKRIERRLDMAVEVTQVVLWEVDFLHDRLMFDQAMLPMLGLEPDELLDSLQAWIERVHPGDLSQFMQRFQLAMQPGNAIFDFEYRLKSKNGNYQWIHTKGSVIQRSMDGQPEFAVGTSMNISARKQIDEAVRNSEERSRNLATLLRLMADNVPDMIWAKDLDKRYLFANKAFCEQLLNARDTDEPLGKTDMFYALRERSSRPDDPAWHTFGELCQDSDAITLERGGPSVFEEYGNIKGSLVYLDVHKAPFVNEKGEVIGTVGSARNITERRCAEEILHESQEKLRAVFDVANAGISITDRNGRYLLSNERWDEILGYGREEIQGLTYEDVTHPDDLEGARIRFQELIEGKVDKYRFEKRYVRKDGSVFWADLSVSAIKDGNDAVINVVGMLVDITARKQAEAELERHRLHLEEMVQQRTAELLATETRAGRILESTADGLYGVDAESRINFINPAACRMFGYTAEQVVGREAHALFHHSRPDGSPYPAEECLARQAWKAGRESRVDNETYWHADGHAIPVALASHPIVEKGEIIGAVVSIVDMSVQHAAALAREQALIAAENLARLRSEFLANMSHEIRTPMNGVLGFAHIGLRNHQDSEKARNAFEKILASGDRLVAVVNEILDFSKIEAGQMQIDAVEMDLIETLDQSLAL
ncbi:MAG: PAS domain S-box protein, partial [Rhodocyclales bacterium]|nr:PAS domain S-box protein [Rhodocyclales bacterium]